MRTLVFLALLVLVASAPAPQEGDSAQAKIVRDERTMNGDGTFSYSWESDDGTKAEATGENKQIGEEFGVAMSGSYQFTAPDGMTYEVRWTADENGFQPQVGPPSEAQ